MPSLLFALSRQWGIMFGGKSYRYHLETCVAKSYTILFHCLGFFNLKKKIFFLFFGKHKD
jgi:hypothetical protein